MPQNSLKNSPSENASNARCRHYPVCGGCCIQHIPYDIQISNKRDSLRDLFSPVLESRLIGALEVVPSPIQWGYRNRMEFTFSTHEERLVLGLHRRKRYWHVVDLEECHLCPQSFLEIVREVRFFARDSGLPAYDKHSHTGFWRYLVVRGSRATNQLLAEVMTTSQDDSVLSALGDHLQKACPSLSGLFWSRVPGIADAAIPDRTERVMGEMYIIERLAGFEIPFGPRTFLQPNVAVAEMLYRDIECALELRGSETVWDLYCGVGSIGASLSHKAWQIWGVEIDKGNVEMGGEMIARNNIANMRILAADVKSLRDEQLDIGSPDVIVVDPPRSGLSKKIMAFLHACNPTRIAYVSCNPKALRDNLDGFSRAGVYRPKTLRAYDMFPHTLHVEILCTLERS